MIGVLRVRGARAQLPEKGLVVGGPEPCQAQAEPVRPELISAGQSVPAGRPQSFVHKCGELELTRFGGRFRYAAFFTECISSNSIGLL